MRKLSLIIILSFAFIFASQVAAQENIQIVDQSWDAEFRDHLTFTLSAKHSTQITEVDLFYRIVGQLATSRNEAEFTPGQSIEAEFTIDQTDPSNYFPPGTELEYWWKLVDAEGNELKTETETLTYIDDRFEWQTLENDRLALYWYEGNENFGQALFERANEALDTLENDVGIALENPIKIFIYANHRDLLGALSVTAQEWTGGVAYTTYGVVVIGINPVQLEWGLGAMTHEMSHLVIHQATDNPFSGLPRWLDEGIAVYNENQDELDDDFRPIFERAVENNQLMTLRTLSSPFPADPVEANLAYGQSGAVVKFIIDTYGTDKMAELLSVFAEGAIYDEALEQVLDVDTDGLDNAFRASLGLPPLPGTESAQEEAPEPAAETESEAAISTENSEETSPALAEEVAAPEPTSTSNVDSSTQAESESQPTTETTSQSPLGFLPCLAGLFTLLVMGGAIYGVRRV